MSEDDCDEPFFCQVCVAQRVAPQRHARGLFSSLLSKLDKLNPSIFVPPKPIREYFEGVAATKSGEFMDAANVKTRSVILGLRFDKRS